MVLNIISVIVGLFVAAFVDAALNTTDDEVEKHYAEDCRRIEKLMA